MMLIRRRPLRRRQILTILRYCLMLLQWVLVWVLWVLLVLVVGLGLVVAGIAAIHVVVVDPPIVTIGQAAAAAV